MKILVRATNWVGDAIMAIPALEAIRARWDGAEIVVLARSWVADLYRGQGYADRGIVFDYRGRHRGILGRERLAAELRSEKFDAALLLQHAFEAAWLAWRAGIPERIGYARDARSWLLTKAIPVPGTGEAPAHVATERILLQIIETNSLYSLILDRILAPLLNETGQFRPDESSIGWTRTHDQSTIARLHPSMVERDNSYRSDDP